MAILLLLLCALANVQSAADSPDNAFTKQMQGMMLSPSQAFHERSDFTQRQNECSKMAPENAANSAFTFLRECHSKHVFSGTEAEWTSYFCLLVFRKTDSDILAPIALNGTILSAPADILPFRQTLEDDAMKFCIEYSEKKISYPNLKQISIELREILPIAQSASRILSQSAFLPFTLRKTEFFIRKYTQALSDNKCLRQNSWLKTFQKSLEQHIQRIVEIGKDPLLTNKATIGALITGKPTAIASLTLNMYTNQLISASHAISAAQSYVKSLHELMLETIGTTCDFPTL